MSENETMDLTEPIVRKSEANVAEPDVVHARFLLRVIALALDWVALYSFSIIVRLIAGQSIDSPSFTFSLFEFVYTCAYFVVMTATFGQTLGKMVMGIKVVRFTSVHLGVFLYRELVGKLLSILTFGIGFLMAGWSRDKRALHDLMSDTYVIVIIEKEVRHERASSQQNS